MNRMMKRYGALLGTLLLVLLMACTVACERKPLYLQVPGNLQVETSVYDIKLEIMWGLDWQTRWQYVWDEQEHGKLGYSEPTGVRSTIYSLDDNLSRSNFFTQNFSIHGGRISLQGGEWYDLLFYNNGTEYILFESDEHYTYYNASTRSTSRSHYVQRPRTRTFVDYNQPDEFFAVFMEKNQVSIDPEDYTIEYDENGGIVYVSTLNAMLRPHSYIYLVQLLIKNNVDAEGNRIVKGARGITLSGLAQSVDLYTGINADSLIAVTTEDIKPLQTDRMLTFPDGTKQVGDVMAARMLTWGVPAIDPLKVVEEGHTVQLADSCYVGVGLTLNNGTVYTIQQNVTKQLEKYPAGGVITIELDAETVPEAPNPGTGGGGFDATVKEWENEINADITI